MCTIVNFEVAQCNPTDATKPEYDLELTKMLGYMCLSPRDTGDVKAYIRQLLEELDGQASLR